MTTFPQASIVEGIQFTAAVGVPNVLQGLFKKRDLVTKVTSTVHTDLVGYTVVSGLVDKHGPGPFLVRVAKDNALLVSAPEDIEFVLGNSPELFASDPPAKKAGMSAFQPDALTISRSDLWAQRRAFAEAVLDSSAPLHRMAGAFLPVVATELAALGDGFGWSEFNRTLQRITRIVLFGAAAADDTALTDLLGDLMGEGNRQPGKPGKRYPQLIERIGEYVAAAEKGSLAELAGRAGTRDIEPAGQMIHWMFAMGDTLAANLMRTFALLATHPEQLREAQAAVTAADVTDPSAVAGLDYVAGCLADTMRLFPTTALFGRVATQDVTFPNGATLPADTQVLIHNLFNHRDRKRFDYADSFAPHEWSNGDAGDQWSFNFFSHGPQGCPGANLAMFLGTAVLAHLVARGTLQVTGTSVRAGKRLPYGMDLAPLRVSTAAS